MNNAIKLLVNSEAGVGKTELLRSMGTDTFVVSRDGKKFGLPLPHFLAEEWVNMSIFLYGGKNAQGEPLEGVTQKIQKYYDMYGAYPTTVAFDSVSQIFMDVINTAAQKLNVYGSQGAEVTKEMGLLTQFIHESLEMSGINIILLNHIIPEKEEGKATGRYLPFGSGKFLERKAFFSITNESITIELSKNQRRVYMRGADKLARTTLSELPDVMWIEDFVHPNNSKKLKAGETYYTLRGHMDLLTNVQSQVGTFAL